MFLQQKPLFFWVDTPLHAGSGTDLGIVDLPIQREKHTNFPKIEASGIKGCLRESFEKILGKDKEELLLAFGPQEGKDEHTASSLGFSDARLLLFPVKSVKDVFAWITCPQVITRFTRELGLCKIEFDFEVPEPNTASSEEICVKVDTVVLEEYMFPVTVKEGSATKNLAAWLKTHIAQSMETFWQQKIEKSLVVLSDENFRDFVTMSTEVIARTCIDDHTGTVAKGALWYEEYLPADSILYSLVFAAPVYKAKDDDKGDFKVIQEELQDGRKKSDIEAQKVMNFFTNNLGQTLQIGGNATVGKGFVRTVFLNQ